jgi:hypothetical protein
LIGSKGCFWFVVMCFCLCKPILSILCRSRLARLIRVDREQLIGRKCRYQAVLHGTFDAGDSFGSELFVLFGSSNASNSSRIALAILNHALQVDHVHMIRNLQVHLSNSFGERLFNLFTVLRVVQPPSTVSGVTPSLLGSVEGSHGRLIQQLWILKVVRRNWSTTERTASSSVQRSLGTQEAEDVSAGQTDRECAAAQTNRTFRMRFGHRTVLMQWRQRRRIR